MVNNLVVCGGTFDRFHKGHEAFLGFAFSVGKKNIVGVTSDDFANSKLKVQNSKLQLKIQNFKIRKENLLEFLKNKNFLDRVEIVEINDLFGPTLDKNLLIDAIVVSQDSRKGAEIINNRRKELGLKELKILVAPQVLAEDGTHISSGRIRNGEINRMGKLYVKKEWLNKNLMLTENLRGEFQKPFGELLLNINRLSKDKDNLVITVGDVTTEKFNEKSLGQNLSAIDFKVERKRRFSNIAELGFSGEENVVHADNPAGYITADLFRKLEEIFKGNLEGKIILQINGEEDLAVLPLVLFAPLSTIIYYGQPHEGMVKIVVSEEVKNKAYNLVLKLKSA